MGVKRWRNGYFDPFFLTSFALRPETTATFKMILLFAAHLRAAPAQASKNYAGQAGAALPFALRPEATATFKMIPSFAAHLLAQRADGG
jgi:hypothetical protein